MLRIKFNISSIIPILVNFIFLLLIISCRSGPTEIENGEKDGHDTDYTPAETWSPDADIWVGAYLASWNHYAPPGGNWGHLRTDEIDWNAFTHLIYFTIRVKSNGTLSPIEPFENLNPDRLNAIVEAAHENLTPVLISVGGWGNYEEFSNAIRPENQKYLVNNLINIMTEWNFDGIDLDMEPIRNEDVENFIAFVEILHHELQQRVSPLGYLPLLTTATQWQPEMFSKLSDKFDQINLMTYDYSGAWENWVSWHNSPIFNGGNTFPGLNRELPAVDNDINRFLNAGIPGEKMGIGIVFTGYVWNGFVNAPLQEWITLPEVIENVPYFEIMQKYYREEYERWDDEAKAAYLSITDIELLNHIFISFDNERSINEKFKYIRENDLGGAIIWELASGHDMERPAGQRNPLLQSVKKEIRN